MSKNLSSLLRTSAITNVVGGNAGQVHYQSGVDTTSFTATGTSGQVLTSNGTSAPTWTTPYTGVSWQSVQTSNFVAVAANAYPINTTLGAVTVTLPVSATAGQQIILTDYAGTWATYNVTVNPNGLKLDGNTSSGTLSTNRSTVSLVYIDAAQGWITYSNVAPVQSYSIDYLIVAGGGGGGSDAGGGGGAGGLLQGIVAVPPGTSYSLVVGAGGAGGTGNDAPSDPTNRAIAGSNSTGFGYTAIGGGWGGMGQYQQRGGGTGSGGSGGGGGGSYPSSGQGGPAGTGTSGQGYNGSAGLYSNETGGGGGGAGAAATDQNGGIGVNWKSLGTYYAGGGGAGGWSSSAYNDGAGGLGGGGNGGGYPGKGTAVGVAGSINTGGGGGGGNQASGAAGGSGIVIIRYAGSQRGTGGTVTSAGGYTYHTFTTSGVFTA